MFGKNKKQQYYEAHPIAPSITPPAPIAGTSQESVIDFRARAMIRDLQNDFQMLLLQIGYEAVDVPAVEAHREIRKVSKSKT